MDDPRQKHGNHTWDIVINYHECPACGFINENRNKYERRFNILHKDIVCARCNKAFSVTKITKPTFGPLLGHE
jgi:rubredoxin